MFYLLDDPPNFVPKALTFAIPVPYSGKPALDSSTLILNIKVPLTRDYSDPRKAQFLNRSPPFSRRGYNKLEISARR